MSDSTTIASGATRSDDVDQFVQLDALSEVVRELVCFADAVWSSRNAGPFSKTDADDLDLILDGPRVGSRDFFERLWPTDEDGASLEWFEAAERSCKLEAQLFRLLAGPFGQEWLVERAMDANARCERMGIRVEELRRSSDHVA